MIRKELRDKIVKQALDEIQFARQHKRGRIASWHTIEDLYYAKKQTTEESRANIELGQMQSFVHTLMSKIDEPLDFKFTKRKLSQLKRVARLNALKAYDAKRDAWNIKDIVGKKQAILYGRAIYAYYAESINGYKPHLEPVDVYDFLIDPSAGGIDIELAKYLGRYGIIKSKKELKDGVKNKMYIADEVKTLLESGGDADTSTVEDTNKDNRSYGTGHNSNQKEIANKGNFKFWEWFTTFEGTRYYLLLSSDCRRAIACDEWKDRDATEMWPFWTWACFPDLTEFWTPGYAEYVSETIMGQSVSINQLVDNAEQRNKPQKLVATGLVENLAELKYRKNGYIKVKGDVDVNKAVQMLEVPSIDTPIKVYEMLSSIQDRNSGVTAGSQGVADDKGKATIYEGNQANAADRFGLLNKSYSYAYDRFAKLYENNVKQHLTQKIAIEILGPGGVDIQDIDKDDIFEIAGETFNVIVESSQAETALSIMEQKMKETYLQSLVNLPFVNQQKLVELRGKNVNYDEETLKQLLTVDEFGTEEILAEAERDIELLLKGDNIKPNMAANNAYKQRFVDYLKNNTEYLSPEEFRTLTTYLSSISQIIDQNMVSALQQAKVKMIQQEGQEGLPQESEETEMPMSSEEETINSMNQI